jgi:glycosyltransferase involved in cell wall biosynthesis
VPVSLRQAGLTDEALQYGLAHVASALAEAGDYDIVHNHNGPPSELALAMSLARPEVPMLTTLHCLLSEETRFVWERYAGWYNVISRQQIAAIPPMPKAHFAGIVHNSIDVASFPFETEKDDYALFIGRICPDKAPHLAVEAARALGVRLIIAGQMRMAWEREYFEGVLEPLLDGETAVYVGEADAQMKRRLYARARCLLMPLAWEEPFGLVMAEAMACGTPVVAFERGAVPEIVTEGVNGFIVQDVEGMIAAARRVGEIDPAACRQSIEDRFGPRAIADRYLEVYRRVLSGRETQVSAQARATNGRTNGAMPAPVIRVAGAAPPA